ncbi:helix-turn-helix domain-containing protein [Salinarimonas soli]|uniref:Helix-turn-helix transcriptional regulator n=1 Tax=Salinarimonas soli TaxID=1638099 RepID=A0A5B2VAN5_9HYPH|nr:AraC family transcriptional regulator [Salinarimonas soli]KAA2236593.1 helix-turn-helix transcriptional regulator [Salinarimonas soli]
MYLEAPPHAGRPLPLVYGPAPDGETRWRSLHLDLPEASVALRVCPGPGERALIEVGPATLAGETDAPSSDAMFYPVDLEPGVAAALVRAADDAETASLAGRPEIRRLGLALVAARASGQPVQQLYAQSMSLAIAARIMERADPRPARRPASPLPKWRLNRVMRHIEENLAERLSLADLAGTAGLTRMYFATQFRASLGVSPHTYVLRRRIERAQEILAGSNESLVQVALSVGFQTQAHFTTVFKRFVGQTPARWRQAQGRVLAPPRRTAAEARPW